MLMLDNSGAPNAEIIKKTFEGLVEANKIERAPATLDKLTLGVKCGGSDGFSGISANPAVGYCADLLVALGGKVLLAEFPELCGVEQDLIDRTIAANSGAIAPALTAADALRLNKEGKLIAFKSMENSYPLGEDLSLLQEFYNKGVRLAGPVHSKDNQFADSATGEGRWKGLSPLGKQWVAEMNRLGIVIDASHASDAAFDQILALSKYPILLSHSSLRSAYNHPRNLDEARLKALAAKGGAMCISTIFMSEMNMSPARAELFGKYEHIGSMTPAEQADLNKRWRELDKTEKLWAVNFEDYMKMVLRAIEVGGVDHICFGADWDGGGGLDGIEDISALPKVTERLKAAGYSDADIEKMWSGNILRVLAAQGK